MNQSADDSASQASNQSRRSIFTSSSGTTVTENGIQEDINPTFNITDWILEKKKRYLIKHLIEPKSKKIDERIELDIVGDQVVWNLIYIKSSIKNLPSTHQGYLQKSLTVEWLRTFRTQMVCEMMKIARQRYLEESMKMKWNITTVEGKKFSSFRQLEEETKESASKTVCTVVEELNDIVSKTLICTFFASLHSLSYNKTALGVQILCQ